MTTYAFFSQTNHDNGIGGKTLESVHTVTGQTKQANYVGPKIGGLPGFMEDGKVVRPPNASTYVIVGEVAPGKWKMKTDQAPNRSGSPRFARRSDFCDPNL